MAAFIEHDSIAFSLTAKGMRCGVVVAVRFGFNDGADEEFITMQPKDVFAEKVPRDLERRLEEKGAWKRIHIRFI
jgi:hypothetical protein